MKSYINFISSNNDCMKIFYCLIVEHGNKIRKCFNLQNFSFKPRNMITSKYLDRNSSDKLSSTEIATFRLHSRNSYNQKLYWRFMYTFQSHHNLKKYIYIYVLSGDNKLAVLEKHGWHQRHKFKKLKCTTPVSWITIVVRAI